MKRLLIVSFLLSLFFGNGAYPDVPAPLHEDESSVSAAASSPCTDHSLNRDLCLTAAQGQTFSGNESPNPVTVRHSQSGRRPSTQTKSTSRTVKNGKITDNNHSHPFLTPAFVLLSGIHISERYLFSLCRLRL